MFNRNVTTQGHRERLRKKFLEGKLADYELLELLLSYAIPRIDVKPIAKNLLAKFGNIHKILSSDVDDLKQVDGVGESAAVLLRLISEIMLLDYKSEAKDTPMFADDQRLENYCRLVLSGKNTEEFHVLYMDRDRRLIEDELHSVGTLDNVAVYPREILKNALALNAKFVVLVHNHPDKKELFSEDDIRLTTEVKRVLGVVQVELIDHLLVSNSTIFSAKRLFLYK